jgi:adenylate cyclase, class 2
MDVELEAKFININKEEIRTKLKNLGAELVYEERLMRRKVYEHPINKNDDWFRVRDEGDRVTLSYKKLNNRSVSGMEEIMFVVPDFDQACRFLENTHLQYLSYQETKREMWLLDTAEITIDTWPWIPTLLEIEDHSEEKVAETASKLGFDMKDALYGSVENVYVKHYDVTERDVCDWPEITFIEIPEWLIKKKRT